MNATPPEPDPAGHTDTDAVPPAPPDRELPRHTALRAFVLSEIEHSGAAAARRTGILGSVLTSRRTVMAACAAALAAAVVAVNAANGGVRSTAHPRTQTVAQVLETAARNADDSPRSPAAPEGDAWVYTVTTNCKFGSCFEERRWDEYSGARFAFKSGQPNAGNDDDLRIQKTNLAALSHIGGSPRRDAYELGKLPAEPSAALREITTDRYFGTPLNAGDGPSKQFERIATVFETSKAMPPRAAAALYRAMALIPNITVVDKPVKDAFGRTGTAIRADDANPSRQVYIILAPKTYSYLGWQLGDGLFIGKSARTTPEFVDGPGLEPSQPAKLSAA